MKKRMISIVTAIAMISCITACGKEAEVSAPETENETKSEAETDTETVVESAEEREKRLEEMKAEAEAEMAAEQAEREAERLAELAELGYVGATADPTSGTTVSVSEDEIWYYIRKDWPVDPRWDEHEGVKCIQVADMFFYYDQPRDEVINEINNSETKNIWECNGTYAIVDGEYVSLSELYDAADGENLYLKADNRINLMFTFDRDENHSTKIFSVFDEGGGLESEVMAAFVRFSKEDVLVPYNFDEDNP